MSPPPSKIGLKEFLKLFLVIVLDAMEKKTLESSLLLAGKMSTEQPSSTIDSRAIQLTPRTHEDLHLLQPPKGLNEQVKKYHYFCMYVTAIPLVM